MHILYKELRLSETWFCLQVFLSRMLFAWNRSSSFSAGKLQYNTNGPSVGTGMIHVWETVNQCGHTHNFTCERSIAAGGIHLHMRHYSTVRRTVVDNYYTSRPVRWHHRNEHSHNKQHVLLKTMDMWLLFTKQVSKWWCWRFPWQWWMWAVSPSDNLDLKQLQRQNNLFVLEDCL